MKNQHRAAQRQIAVSPLIVVRPVSPDIVDQQRGHRCSQQGERAKPAGEAALDAEIERDDDGAALRCPIRASRSKRLRARQVSPFQPARTTLAPAADAEPDRAAAIALGGTRRFHSIQISAVHGRSRARRGTEEGRQDWRDRQPAAGDGDRRGGRSGGANWRIRVARSRVPAAWQGNYTIPVSVSARRRRQLYYGSDNRPKPPELHIIFQFRWERVVGTGIHTFRRNPRFRQCSRLKPRNNPVQAMFVSSSCF